MKRAMILLLAMLLTVPRDSYAQQYAQDNGIPFEIAAK